MFRLRSVATAEESKRWTCIRPTLPPLLELFFRSPETTVMDRVEWKSKTPILKFKDETVQRINHTIFPSLNLCQREGWGFYGYMYIYHNAIIFFPHRILHESLGTIISPILWRGKQTALWGT